MQVRVLLVGMALASSLVGCGGNTSNHNPPAPAASAAVAESTPAQWNAWSQKLGDNMQPVQNDLMALAADHQNSDQAQADLDAQRLNADAEVLVRDAGAGEAMPVYRDLATYADLNNEILQVLNAAGDYQVIGRDAKAGDWSAVGAALGKAESDSASVGVYSRRVISDFTTGSGNTGTGNTGDSGSGNTGSGNTGDSGSGNTGTRNTGDSGSGNTGTGNTGT